VLNHHGLDQNSSRGEPLSFKWLLEECRQGVEDLYRLWGLCIMLKADVRVEENAIKIVKNDH